MSRQAPEDLPWGYGAAGCGGRSAAHRAADGAGFAWILRKAGGGSGGAAGMTVVCGRRAARAAGHR